MHTSRWVVSAMISVAVTACGNAADPGLGGNADGDAGASGDAQSADATPTSDAGTATNDAGAGGNDGGAPIDGGSGSPCYSETYHPTADVSTLKSAYTSSGWLATSLEVMNRRYATGHFILDTEKADNQLPGFADPATWQRQMEALMTMVHEETHGYDFEHSTSGKHAYVLRDDLVVSPPELPNMWTRSELVAMITDNATQSYDNVYLTGTQGTYDVVFLCDELNAYTNGLAAITAVADQCSDQISARDGVAAHLYYLELYLKRGRTAHPTEYAAMKADPAWQKLVRYAWARGHFWDAQAKPFPVLDIASTPIWAHVNEPAMLDEIKRFTGDDAATVACHP